MQARWRIVSYGQRHLPLYRRRAKYRLPQAVLDRILAQEKRWCTLLVSISARTGMAFMLRAFASGCTPLKTK